MERLEVQTTFRRSAPVKHEDEVREAENIM